MAETKPSPKEKELANIFSWWGAFVYASLIPVLTSKYGEEMRKTVFDTLYTAGKREGEKLARLAKKKDLQDFYDIFMKTIDQAWEIEWIEKSPKKIVCRMHECPFHTAWQAMGLDQELMGEVSDTFCVPADEGIRVGFNPKIYFKHTKRLPKGDHYCEFYHELKD